MLTHLLTIAHSHSLFDANINIDTHFQHVHDARLPPEVQIVPQAEIATLTPEPSISLQTVHGDYHTHLLSTMLLDGRFSKTCTCLTAHYFFSSSNRSFPEFRLMISPWHTRRAYTRIRHTERTDITAHELYHSFRGPATLGRGVTEPRMDSGRKYGTSPEIMCIALFSSFL